MAQPDDSLPFSGIFLLAPTAPSQEDLSPTPSQTTLIRLYWGLVLFWDIYFQIIREQNAKRTRSSKINYRLTGRVPISWWISRWEPKGLALGTHNQFPWTYKDMRRHIIKRHLPQENVMGSLPKGQCELSWISILGIATKRWKITFHNFKAVKLCWFLTPSKSLHVLEHFLAHRQPHGNLIYPITSTMSGKH